MHSESEGPRLSVAPREDATPKAIVACLIVATIFASHYVAAKIILTGLTAPTLGAARGLVGGLLLTSLFWRQVRTHVTLKRVPVLAAIAVLGFCCNQLLLFAGLERTTPANAAVLSSTIPVVASSLALALRIDRFSWRRVAGLAIGGTTITWYLLSLRSVELHHYLSGNLLVLANVFCFCSALLMVKRLARDVPPVVIASTTLLGGGLGLWAYGGDASTALEFAAATPANFALMFFECVVTTAVAYTLNYWALAHLSVSATSAFGFFQPPMTALLAWMTTGDSLSPELALAFFGVTVACYTVAKSER